MNLEFCIGANATSMHWPHPHRCIGYDRERAVPISQSLGPPMKRGTHRGGGCTQQPVETEESCPDRTLR